MNAAADRAQVGYNCRNQDVLMGGELEHKHFRSA
jgi:hypothetical protein